MIMKKYIFLGLIGAMGLAGCQNYFDEKQLDNGDYHVTDVRTSMTYTLTEEDVALIGKPCSYKGNDTVPSVYEQKALSLCTEEDSMAYYEWRRISVLKAFTEDASADLYVPMFMAFKFPYLDAGTICNVTYPLYEGKSSRVQEFKSAGAYTLTEDDYRTIWGGRGADFLNSESEKDIPAFLATKFPLSEEGKIMVLDYKFLQIEPDTIYPPLPYVCSIAEFLAAQEKEEHQLTGVVGTVKSERNGRFYLVDGSDSIYVYGLVDETGAKAFKEKSIKSGDQLTLKGVYSVSVDEPIINNAIYVSHTPSNAPARFKVMTTLPLDTLVKSVIYQLTNGTWQVYENEQLTVAEALPNSVYASLDVYTIENPEEVLHTYLQDKYRYPKEKQIYLIAYNGTSGVTADEFTYDGTDFIMNTGYVDDVMSFVYTNTWVANISTYYTTPFVGDGPADFTIQHVNLDGLNYVWRYQAAYGMTASAYVSGSNHPVEDWLVSPKIRLKKSVAPYLTFMHAVRYGNEQYNKEWLKVMVTNNFTGDVTTTEWEHLEFPDSIPDGSNWTFLSTGKFDLSKYNNESIVIAFQYNTTTGELTSAPTWEIQQLLVAEEEDEKGTEE